MQVDSVLRKFDDTRLLEFEGTGDSTIPNLMIFITILINDNGLFALAKTTQQPEFKAI